MAAKPELWSGALGFVLANVASAVGLGSIWKFLYEVGTNGGSAFVFFYLVGVGLIVLPLMLAELVIGRRGRSDAIRSIVAVARSAGASLKWSYFGMLGIITGFFISVSVIGGWALAYLVDTIRVGLPGADASMVQERFDTLLRSPYQLGLYHFIFMTMTALIVARGIAGGIERASTILMPCLAVLVAALAVYSAIQGDLAATLRFFFSFDLTHMRPEVALEALGLGFFRSEWASAR